MEMFRTFPAELWERALREWTWLGLESKTPFCASPFGDVFLEASDGIWWLDQLEGTLSREFDSREHMNAVLESEEKQDHYLLAALALGAERRGLHPGPEEVYGFRVPPVLGAPVDFENITTCPYVPYAIFTGQTHRHLNDLEPGTPTSSDSAEETT